jgi:hypothetical protein
LKSFHAQLFRYAFLEPFGTNKDKELTSSNGKSKHEGGASHLQITFFRPVQPQNALPPILVTLLGMVIEVRPVHP